MRCACPAAKRDDLQSAIALVKKSITDFPVQFGNFRDWPRVPRVVSLPRAHRFAYPVVLRAFALARRAARRRALRRVGSRADDRR